MVTEIIIFLRIVALFSSKENGEKMLQQRIGFFWNCCVSDFSAKIKFRLFFNI